MRVPLMMYIPGKTCDIRNHGKIFPQINPVHAWKARQNSHRLDNHIRNVFSNHEKFKSNERYFTDTVVELVDIFPTVSQLAGLGDVSRCPKQRSSSIDLCTEGKSLIPVINSLLESNNNDNGIVWNSTAFSQYPRPSKTPTQDSDEPRYNNTTILGYSVRTTDYRYTEWVRFEPSTGICYWDDVYGQELYSHGGDGLEDVNLVGKPQFKIVARQLSDLLHRNIVCSNSTHKTDDAVKPV